jgi:outer membrane immunogenic protein
MYPLRSIALGLAILPTLLGNAAHAAEFGQPYRVPEWVEYRPYNWSGLYLGGNIGGGFSNGGLTNLATGASWNAGYSGGLGGGQLGYNFQVSQIVLGAEWTFDRTSMSATGAPINTVAGLLQSSSETHWINTLAGHLGIASNNWLFYALAAAIKGSVSVAMFRCLRSG